MSPRRSPRLIEPSPKPELPKKPRQPRRVENPAEDSVRQANYLVELKAWEAATVEHEGLMKKRRAKQNAASKAAWKAARKSSAEKDAPPPAALAPPPQLSADEARLVGSPALAEGRELAAVERPLPPRQERRRFPRLSPRLARWVLDVEHVANRCGADDCQLLSHDGDWYDLAEYEGVPGLAPHPAPHPAPTPPDDMRACCRVQEANQWSNGSGRAAATRS